MQFAGKVDLSVVSADLYETLIFHMSDATPRFTRLVPAHSAGEHDLLAETDGNGGAHAPSELLGRRARDEVNDDSTVSAGLGTRL